jgi:hypothetical protein
MLKPVMSDVLPIGWGEIPVEVICSSSTSVGKRRAAASSSRKQIVRARCERIVSPDTRRTPKRHTRQAELLSAWNNNQ